METINAKIEYNTRLGGYMYWISKNGEEKPLWREGGRSVDAARIKIETAYPSGKYKVLYTISG